MIRTTSPIKWLTLAGLLLSFAACSESGVDDTYTPNTGQQSDDKDPDNVIDEQTIQLKTYSIAAVNPMTRATYSDNGTALNWDESDKLALYHGTESTPAIFALKDASLNTFATTELAEKPTDSPFELFYPASIVNSADSDKPYDYQMTMSGQVQSINNSTSHLAQKTYLYATCESLDEQIGVKQQTAQLKFVMKLSSKTQADLVKGLRFECTNSKSPFVVEQQINGENKIYSNKLEMALEIPSTDIGSDLTLYLYAMILPSVLEDCSLRVSLLDSDNNEIDGLYKEESGITRYFDAGFQYYALEQDVPYIIEETIISSTDIYWQQFGPGMSGNNKSAHWHPTDPNYLYISPNMGNSYLSTDKGKTYQTLLNCDAKGYKSATAERGMDEITSLDFSRQDDTFGFATDTSKKGIYKTTDKGQSWSVYKGNGNILDGIYMACVAVDPTDDNIWYLAGGNMRDRGSLLFPSWAPHGTDANANTKCNLFRSSDGGVTWKTIETGVHSLAEAESIIVDPNTPTTLYLSTNYGFYKSTNSGSTWEKKTIRQESSQYNSEGEVIRSMVMHYTKVDQKVTLFAVSDFTWKDGYNNEGKKCLTDEGGGVYRSDDGGESWTQINGVGNGTLALDLSSFTSGNYNIKNSYDNPASYYVSTTGSSSGDTSQFWIDYPGLPNKLTQRFEEISVDPNDPNHLFLTNDYSNASLNNYLPGALWSTKDGGNTWFIAFRNGTQWHSDSTHNALVWSKRTYQPMGSNVTLRYLTEWFERADYDSKAITFAKFNCDGTVLHAEDAKISLMSYDGGDNWVDIDDEYTDSSSTSTAIVGAGNSNLPGHGFFQHADYPGIVYCCAGENSLWITSDETSSERAGALAASNVRFTDSEMSLSSYAIDPLQSNIHYALFFRQTNMGKLMRSVDGGETWAVHGEAIPQWDQSAYSGDQSVHQVCLTIDPRNTRRLFFCVPRRAGDLQFVGDSKTAYGVYRSEDGGANWVKVTNGLPDNDEDSTGDATASVPRIALDPNTPNTIYAAVERQGGGLFKSTDNGDNWVRVATPIDNYTQNSTKCGVNDIHFAEDGAAYITIGSKNVHADDYGLTGLWVSRDGSLTNWVRVFNHPFTARVESAKYDSKVLMVTALGHVNSDYINPGVYLSRDGGYSWCKLNMGNGQSDRVNDIAINYTRKGCYYASTYGSGFYYAYDERYF